MLPDFDEQRGRRIIIIINHALPHINKWLIFLLERAIKWHLAVEHVKIALPALISFAALASAFSLASLSAGVIFIMLGATGVTTLAFLGLHLNIQSVGVAIVTIAAVLLGVVMLRLAKTLRHLAALPPDIR